MATRERIQEQRKHFHPWKPGSALFVDGVNPVETNLERVLGFVTAADVVLEPPQVGSEVPAPGCILIIEAAPPKQEAQVRCQAG